MESSTKENENPSIHLEEDKLHIPQNIFGLFGDVIEADQDEDFTVRAYRIKNNNREVPAYCGKFENEEVDEELIAEKFGIGKYKCVLHLPKSRRNFTKTVHIDDSFINLSNPTRRQGGASQEWGGPSSLGMMRELLSVLRPFILERPAIPENPFLNMERMAEMFQKQFEKLQTSMLNIQTARIKEIGTMEVGQQSFEDEGDQWGVRALYEKLTPFIPLILKGLIPKNVIDNVLGDMGLKEELEAKGEMFDAFCEVVKQELGEEKAKALLQKAVG